MKVVRLIVVLAAILAFMPPVLRADQIDDAYRDFLAGRYGIVFGNLFAYRLANEGTLRVDFMLGVSACRLSDKDFKALGGYLLAQIPKWYRPLRSDHERDVRIQAQVCPNSEVSEEQVIAKLKGKTDTGGKERLAAARSNSGKDQALPRVVQPPPALGVRGMSPLMQGQGFLGGTDYRNVQVASATECSSLCDKEGACVAMTFIISQKMCNLKNALTQTSATSDMISAVKRK